MVKSVKIGPETVKLTLFANNLTWLDREKSVQFAEIDPNRSESVENGRKSWKKWSKLSKSVKKLPS